MAEKKCNGRGIEKAPASVPYVVHESDMANERQREILKDAMRKIERA